MNRTLLAICATTLALAGGASAAPPVVPPLLPAATLHITADNTLLGLWCNGEAVATDPDLAADWMRPEAVRLPLVPGRNVIAVHARDEGVIAGLLAELDVAGTTLVSDGAWRVSAEAPDGWWRADFDDGAWPQASTYGAWPESIWGTRVASWTGTSRDTSWIWTATNELHGAIDREAHFRLTLEVAPAWNATTPGALVDAWADLDGDGLPDRARLARDGDRAHVVVHWGKGGREVLGPMPGVEDGQVLETVDDFSWLVHWRRTPNTGGGYDIPILHGPVRFERPEARGDALHCSSTDVATLLYLTADGWRLEHLGY